MTEVPPLPPELASLPEWARRAFQTSVSAKAAAPRAAGEAHAQPEWPLLVDAALVSSFLPRDLAPAMLSGVEREAAEKSVLGLAEITHGPEGRQWSLRPDARRDVLNYSIVDSTEELDSALHRTGERFKDPISSALRAWIIDHRSGHQPTGKNESGVAADASSTVADPISAAPAETDDLRTLEARRAALALLEGVTAIDVPDLPALNREVGLRRMLRQFERMTGDSAPTEGAQQRNHFYGRKDQLETLRSYVAEVQAETFRQRVTRGAKLLLQPFRARKPIALWGIGGVGKTTLLAKFMLEHARVAASRFPFAYLDFDRSTVSVRNPAALLAEICSQISVQFEQLSAQLANLQRQAEELAKGAANESLTTEISDSLRLLLRSFRDCIDNLLDSLERALEFRRPFLLVFDTFEIVQYSPDQVKVLESFVQGFSESDERGLWPRLRLIVSGRQEVMEFAGAVEPLPLGVLDPQGCTQMLVDQAAEANKPISPELAASLVEALAVAAGRKPGTGVHPLRLRLLGDVLRQAQETDGAAIAQSLIGELKSQLSISGLAGRMFVDGILVRRLLDHVNDKRVRALADPGLVVRHINRDVIRYVMVPATPDPEKTQEDVGDSETFPLWTVDEKEASDIFEAMTHELTVIEPDGADLRHRQDVRREMLPLMEARRPRRFRHVHERAFEFFGRAARTDPRSHLAAAEAIYHGLWLGVPYEQLDSLWVSDPLFDPRIDPDEFRVGSAANVYIRARLGRPLTNSEIVRLSRPFALRWLTARVSDFLDESSPEKPLERIRAATSGTYGGIEERPQVVAVTARLLYRAGLWRDAIWLVRRTMGSEAPGQFLGSSLEDRDGILSLTRTRNTLVAKSGASAPVARDGYERLQEARQDPDPIVRAELMAYAGIPLAASGDPIGREILTAAARSCSDIGPSTWVMYLRVLRLVALACGDIDRSLIATYIRFSERLPREREVYPDIERLFAAVYRNPRQSEMQRVRGYLNPQRFASFGITAQAFRKQSFLAFRGLEHDGGRAIAKQNSNIPVGPVHEGRDELCADHQRPAHHAGANHGRGCGQGVKEARTRGIYIHGRRRGRLDPALDGGGHVGYLVAITAGAEHNQVDIAAFQSRRGQGTRTGDVGQFF